LPCLAYQARRHQAPLVLATIRQAESEDVGERFQLFRVFDFARAPRVYVFTGSLKEICRLEPTLYRATI
jgi:hypothetical protein